MSNEIIEAEKKEATKRAALIEKRINEKGGVKAVRNESLNNKALIRILAVMEEGDHKLATFTITIGSDYLTIHPERGGHYSYNFDMDFARIALFINRLTD
jgi:hypothetical protein